MKKEAKELLDVMAKMVAMSAYQETLPSVKTTYRAEEKQVSLPVLHHAVLRELFTCGNNLPQEIRAQILALPADTLAADLCALMEYAIADFERIKSDSAGEGWLLTHAYFLGGAVAHASIPGCLLTALSQPEKVLDVYFGDLLTEGAWWSMYQHLPEALVPCMAFLKRPGIYGYAKWIIIQAMRYLYRTRPELQEQITACLLDLAAEYLARREEEDFADFVVAGEIAFALIEDSGREAHLQVAKRLFEAGLVDEFIAGPYEEVVADRHLHHDYKDLPFTTLDEVYEHIAGFTDPDDFVSDEWGDEEDDQEEDEFTDWEPVEHAKPLPANKPFVAPEKIGRNEPCPCGSGKKYKKCCLNKGA